MRGELDDEPILNRAQITLFHGDGVRLFLVGGVNRRPGERPCPRVVRVPVKQLRVKS